MKHVTNHKELLYKRYIEVFYIQDILCNINNISYLVP